MRLNVRRLIVVGCLIVAIERLASAQQPVHTIKSYLLESGAANPISVPAFSAQSHRCDAQGNIFFDLAGSSMYSVKLILRVPVIGGDPTPIPLPTDVGTAGEWNVAVDSNGMLYALYSEADKHVLIRFTNAGTELSRTILQLPRYFHIQSFAINHEGGGMFFGTTPVSDEAAVTRSRPQSIVLDSQGHLILNSPRGGSVNRAIERPEGQIVEGPANTFLEVSAFGITSFDERGNPLRSFALQKPRKASFVSNVQYSDGIVALEYSYSAKSSAENESGMPDSSAVPTGPLAQTWSLVDLGNAEVEGFFQSPSNLIGSALCYAGSHRFIYLSVIDGVPTLVEASEK